MRTAQSWPCSDDGCVVGCDGENRGIGTKRDIETTNSPLSLCLLCPLCWTIAIIRRGVEERGDERKTKLGFLRNGLAGDVSAYPLSNTQRLCAAFLHSSPLFSTLLDSAPLCVFPGYAMQERAVAWSGPFRVPKKWRWRLLWAGGSHLLSSYFSFFFHSIA